MLRNQKQAGFYEAFADVDFTIWLGTATAETIKKYRAYAGGFIGYGAPTTDGWACRAQAKCAGFMSASH